MKISNGDILAIEYKNGDIFYGEKVGEENDLLHVFLLEYDDEKMHYKYTSDVHTIDKKYIIEHVKNNGDYSKTWSKFNIFIENPKAKPEDYIFHIIIESDNDNESILSNESTCSETSSSTLGSLVDFLEDDHIIQFENGEIHNNCECVNCTSINTEPSV